MATHSVPNNLTNGNTIDAEELDTNFTSLSTFVNNSVVHADGSRTMTAPLKIPATLEADTSTVAASKGYVDSKVAGSGLYTVPLGINFSKQDSGSYIHTTVDGDWVRVSGAYQVSGGVTPVTVTLPFGVTFESTNDIQATLVFPTVPSSIYVVTIAEMTGTNFKAYIQNVDGAAVPQTGCIISWSAVGELA